APGTVRATWSPVRPKRRYAVHRQAASRTPPAPVGPALRRPEEASAQLRVPIAVMSAGINPALQGMTFARCREEPVGPALRRPEEASAQLRVPVAAMSAGINPALQRHDVRPMPGRTCRAGF